MCRLATIWPNSRARKSCGDWFHTNWQSTFNKAFLPLLLNPIHCTRYYELNASGRDGSNENKPKYCLGSASFHAGNPILEFGDVGFCCPLTFLVKFPLIVEVSLVPPNPWEGSHQ